MAACTTSARRSNGEAGQRPVLQVPGRGGRRGAGGAAGVLALGQLDAPGRVRDRRGAGVPGPERGHGPGAPRRPAARPGWLTVPPVALIERPEWLASYFAYRPGQHAAWFYPTQMGKTHLVYQCAGAALARNPGLQLVSLMPKARSPATRRHAARLGLQILDDWPPPQRWPWQDRPAGYVLWPKHLKDAPVKDNREHLARIFRKALHELLWRGES